MEFYTVQINQITFKTFSTFNLAVEFVQKFNPNDPNIQIFHEEYCDDGHSDAHGYKTLVWPKTI